jgi:hypothetical protein
MRLIPADATLAGSAAVVSFVAEDAAAAMRRLPPPPHGPTTGADLTLQAVKHCASKHPGSDFAWVEDLGDELTKWPQENKRNLERQQKGGLPAGSQTPWSLDADVSKQPKTYLVKVYEDRDGGRREWQVGLGALVTSCDPLLRTKLNAALGGVRDFHCCGVGGDEVERKRILTLRAGEGGGGGPQQRGEAVVTGSSSQREDTNLFHVIVPTVTSGKTAQINATDTDLILICTLCVNELQQVHLFRIT